MSNCQLELTGRKEGERFVFRCANCGEEAKGKRQESPPKKECGKAPKAIQLAPPPQIGVGSEFVGVTNELGLRAKGGCNCQSLKNEMNRLGVAGCREQKEELLAKLQANAKEYSWLETLSAGAAAVTHGLPLTLEGLFDEAIRRAEAKGHLRPPLTVAFLTPSLLLGGAERWIASLCRHFNPAKVWPQAVALVEPKNRSPVVEGWLPKHIKVASAELLPSITSQVDVLIAWGTVDLAARTKVAKCQIVEVQHGTIGFGEHQRKLARAGIDAGARLVSVGEACLDNYPAEYRGDVTVIQNGAEVDRLQPIEGREATRAKLGIQPGEKVCLYIGRIAAVKNLAGLAAAINLLPDWRLVVAGPAYSPVELGERAIVLPPQEQLGDLFAAADVFCAPSHHEANSLAVMEAWLAGVPTVTTDYPAAMEMERRHGSMSWLVPINPSPGVLADAIQEAGEWRDSPAVKRAQQIALENYSAEAMTRRWENFLCQLKTA